MPALPCSPYYAARADTHKPRCTNLNALADALAACRALAHLDVSYNALSQYGVQHLAARLHTCPALRVLNLPMCVRASFTHSLADGVARCSRLTHLRVNYNNISCDAATGYARALERCHALVLLDLTGNALHCAGAAALARALERCQALADLRLPFNYIGFLGAAVLLEASARCLTLTNLDLSNNVLGRARPASNRFTTGPQRLTSVSFERLHHAAGQCTALRSLSLAYNYFSEPEKVRLVDRWGPERPDLALQNE